MRLNATSVLFHRRGWVENKQHISISDISVLCVDQRGSRSSWVSFSTAYTANKQANIQCCFVRSLPPSLHSPSPSLAQDWCVVAGFMCCFRVCVCVGGLLIAANRRLPLLWLTNTWQICVFEHVRHLDQSSQQVNTRVHTHKLCLTVSTQHN